MESHNTPGGGQQLQDAPKRCCHELVGDQSNGETFSSTKPNQEPRVIVLGAGLAGLQCANKLVHSHGLKENQVVILEASNRAGGRIKTDSTLVPGWKIDLGAELVHGMNTSLFNIANEKGWVMEEFFTLSQGDGGPLPCEDNDAFGIFYLGGEQRILPWDSEDDDFVHLNKYLRSLGDNYEDIRAANRDAGYQISLFEGLATARVGKAMMGVAEAGYANTVGAALTDTGLEGISYLESTWDADGDGTFLLKGSLGLVVEELSRGIERCIKTDWPALTVEWSSVSAGGIEVVSRDGMRETGTHLVCSVPLIVLQKGDITFVPPLPEKKTEALSKMGMLNCVKIVLKFGQQFLPPLMHGCICSESFVPEFWFRQVEVPESKDNRDVKVVEEEEEGGTVRAECVACLAVGFLTGPKADVASTLPMEEVLARALKQLDEMFSCQDWLNGFGAAAAASTTPPMTDSNITEDGTGAGAMGATSTPRAPTISPSSCYLGGLVQDWGGEAFIRGGYSYPKPGFDCHTGVDVAAPLEGRLFFAGEHANILNGMTAHGAMDSGTRAAREVFEAIGASRAAAESFESLVLSPEAKGKKCEGS